MLKYINAFIKPRPVRDKEKPDTKPKQIKKPKDETK